MYKTLVAFFLTLLVMQATDLELICGSVDSNGSVVSAQDDVNVFYDELLVSSSSMKYDRNSSIIDFEGDIRLTKGSEFFIAGERLQINTQEQTKSFEPLFLHQKQSNLWFSATSAKARGPVYELEDAIVSSCNPLKPEWKISYSSGQYDTEQKWVDLYNIVFYAGDVPFFYLPYFAFSTDTTRRSGFLIPTLGISATEGIVYEQPYYIAVDNSWDMEIRVQKRTDRGEGLFTDIRFVDSATSKGKIAMGYFHELNDDNETFGWSNKEHFGIDIDYDGTHYIDSWFKGDVTDKLFTDIQLYNDVDYVSLQSRKDTLIDTSTFLTSRINYMIYGESNYLGLYTKYFYDMTADTTTNTLQELPQMQYHKYVDNLFWDSLSYSFDYTTTARKRVNNVNAYENVFTAPVVFSTALFGDYLNISLSEDISLSNINFHQTDGNTSFEEGNFFNVSQTLRVNTDVMKKYEENIHAIRFGASYLFPGTESKSGFYENKEGQFDDETCTTGELCEFVQGSIEPVDKKVDVEFIQYLFDAKGQEWFYHKVAQPITIEDNTTFGSLENEIRIKLTDNVTLYNDTFYDMQTDKFAKVSSSLSYNGRGLTTSLGHLFQDQPQINRFSDYYTFRLKYNSGKYTYILEHAYDNLLKEGRNSIVGLKMKKRCWSYELQFSERVIPTSSASLTDQYLSFRINLIPIAGVGYQHELSSEQK